MIDPFTAIAAATTAFNTVKKFVNAGQDFENTVGQMGKWYTAVSDFRKGHQMNKKPPLFKSTEHYRSANLFLNAFSCLKRYVNHLLVCPHGYQ